MSRLPEIPLWCRLFRAGSVALIGLALVVSVDARFQAPSNVLVNAAQCSLATGHDHATMATADCWPDATNTGYAPTGVSLTAYSGATNITADGTTIDSKDITGCLTVNADNVTIKRSKISGCNTGTRRAIELQSGTNFLLEDVTGDCGDQPNSSTVFYDGNQSDGGTKIIRRVNVSACENGLWVEQDGTVEDSYIHDPTPCCTAEDPHVDGIQAAPFSGNDVTIRHNKIIMSTSNSAITLPGGVTNVLIEYNLMAGGGYTMRCELFRGPNTDLRVNNNWFSTQVFYPKVGEFGPTDDCGTDGIMEFTGNECYETGTPIVGGSSSTVCS